MDFVYLVFFIDFKIFNLNVCVLVEKGNPVSRETEKEMNVVNLNFYNNVIFMFKIKEKTAHTLFSTILKIIYLFLLS